MPWPVGSVVPHIAPIDGPIRIAIASKKNAFCFAHPIIAGSP
jgi:hypothetical protein